MQVVYYRNPDGTIYGFNNADALPFDELSQRIEDYNRKNSAGKTAELVIIEPGSFMEHLYNRAKENIRFQIDTLRDLHSSLQEAESYAYDLLCQAEKERKL